VCVRCVLTVFGALRLTRTHSTKSAFPRLLFLACVLLVAFASFAQAVHVHSENSKLPSHECSVCSVAHAGVIGSSVFHSAPLIARTFLTELPETVSGSSGFVFFLRIRPPPAV
jgi:hypothetical protein